MFAIFRASTIISKIFVLALAIVAFSCKQSITSKLDNQSPIYSPDRPHAYLMNSDLAQSLTQTLTTPSCENIASIYITENYYETPIGTENNWQTCTTSPGAYTYTLTTNTIGEHWLYVWSKNRKGKIAPQPKVIPLKYVPDVIWGQANESENRNIQLGLNNPNSISYINSKFYVTVRNYSQINVYNSIPTTAYPVPDSYLGQLPNRPHSLALSKNYFMQSPSKIESDGTRFVVLDQDGNRALIWNTIPTSPTTMPDLVLGQNDFLSKSPNKGKFTATNGNLDCSDLYAPSDVKIVGNKLLISDSSNNRVLIWDNWPTSNGQAANRVLGQPDCTRRLATPVSASSLYGPNGIMWDGTHLAIADANNHRILIWNSFPTTDAQAADLVLGKTAFSSASANWGGLSASSLWTPRKVIGDGTNLITSDASNNRILIWSTFPTTNGQAANVVLGQADFTSNTANRGTAIAANTLNSPSGIALINGDLWVTDSSNNRILKYNGIPTTSNADAVYVMGKASLNSQDMSTGAAEITDHTVARPYALEFTNNGFLVADWVGSRILGFNSRNISNTTAADFVLGQDNFTDTLQNKSVSASTLPSATTVSGPSTMLKIGSRFFVVDTGNNRVLGYNSVPTSGSSTPDIVLGQPDFTSKTANNGGVSAYTMNDPRSIASDGTKLAVVDKGNNRVLIWNTIPSASNVPADVVVGQQTFTGNLPNGAISYEGSLNIPMSAVFAEGKLIVSDFIDSRVLIWNTIPSVNGVSADLVLGMDNLTDWYNYSGDQAMKPRGLYYRDGKLFLIETQTGAVKIWDSLPTVNNQPPSRIFGIWSYPVGMAETPALQTNQLIGDTYDVKSDSYRLWITQYGAARLNITAIPEFSITSSLYTNDPQIKLTVHSCQNRSKVIFTESTDVPSSTATGWQNCSTTRDALTYTLSNSTNGVKVIRAWFKDEDGYVVPASLKASLWFDTINDIPPMLTSISASLINTDSVTITVSNTGSGMTHARYFVSESATTPSASDSGWVSTTNITYTLANQVNGTHTIYIWSKDPAGNISQYATPIQVVFDNTPPNVPTASIKGFYSDSNTTVARVTLDDCTDINKVLINDGTTPSVTDSGWAACSTVEHNFAYTMNGATEGNHSLSIWTKDLAENISSSSRNLSLTFDAQLVLGQADLETVATANVGFSSPTYVHSDGSNYVVTDYSNSRVLIYNGDPISNSPAVYLGQSDSTHIGYLPGGTATASNLAGPYKSIIVGTKLIVADSGNNRVLIWNTIPTSNLQPADVVLGQPDFTSNTANNGTRSCSTMNVPRGVASDGTRLFVADSGNLRVLVFNTIPTSSSDNGKAADLVLGQASCTANVAATTQNTLKTSNDVTLYNGKILVADTSNNRILIWNSLPASNGADADVVVGQTNFTNGGANQGGSASQSSLSTPNSIFVDANGIMYVSDSNNNRLLIYSSIPTTSGANATYVVGQANFTTVTGAQAANKVNSTRGVFANNSYLWVPDLTYHQIKRFNLPISASNPSATNQVGGYDFVTGYANSRNNSSTTNHEFYRPYSSIIVGTKLIVADTSNNRVLIWNTLPTTDNQQADVVIGHNDFTTTTYNDPVVGAAGRLRFPTDVNSDGTNLIVTDQSNHRVLIFPSIPTSNGALATKVLGQTTYTAVSSNRGTGVAAGTLSSPNATFISGDKLYVADYGNNRVLVWNNYNTAASGQNADFVFGQPALNVNTANNGGRSASTLSGPRSIIEANGKLLIVDDNNNRVLIWNSIPDTTTTSYGPAAQNVLGQSTFGGGSAATSSSGLNGPMRVRYLNNKLFIVDRSSNRIKVHNTIPTTDYANADYLLGQKNTTNANYASGGLSAWSYALPQDIIYDNGSYWITDTTNHRVIKVSIPFN